MNEALRYAWSSRRVWWYTATSRTKARFVRTKLGSFWLGFSNLLSIAVLAIVYGAVFKIQDFDAYVVYLGTGLVLWNSISAAVGSAPNLFEHNLSHLHNTNLHPVFYTLEEWAFQLQTFAQSFVMVLMALSFYNRALIPNLLLSGWLPLFNFCLFLYWVPLMVCLLGARFRDVYQLVPIALQLVFLLSPILYDKSALGGKAWIADFNPLYRIMSMLRHTLMTGDLLLAQNLIILLMNGFGFLLALYWLKKERKNLPFLV